MILKEWLKKVNKVSNRRLNIKYRGGKKGPGVTQFGIAGLFDGSKYLFRIPRGEIFRMGIQGKRRGRTQAAYSLWKLGYIHQEDITKII